MSTILYFDELKNHDYVLYGVCSFDYGNVIIPIYSKGMEMDVDCPNKKYKQTMAASYSKDLGMVNNVTYYLLFKRDAEVLGSMQHSIFSLHNLLEGAIIFSQDLILVNGQFKHFKCEDICMDLDYIYIKYVLESKGNEE